MTVSDARVNAALAHLESLGWDGIGLRGDVADALAAADEVDGRRDLHEALSDIQFHKESAAGESWEDAYKEVVQIATDALAKIREAARS